MTDNAVAAAFTEARQANNSMAMDSVLAKHPYLLQPATTGAFILRRSIRCGELEMCKIFVNHGVDVNLPLGEWDCNGILFEAVSPHSWSFDMVEWLISQNAIINISRSGHENCPALNHAAYIGATDIAKLLLKSGALLNGVHNSRTALDWAYSSNQNELIEHLRLVGGLRSCEL